MDQPFYDYNNKEYVYRKKLGNQTLSIILSIIDWSNNTIHWNIYLHLYSKRKQIDKNLNNKVITGQNPMVTGIMARNMLREIEKMCVDQYYSYYTHIFTCGWIDNRRRNAYYRVLSKDGYSFGMIDGEKCLYKKVKKNKEV